MAELPKTPIHSDWSVNIRYLQDGKTSVRLWIPDELHQHVGRVVAQWGSFEAFFDAVVDCLLREEIGGGQTRTTGNWKKRSFGQRCKLFESLCNEWVSLKSPELAEQLYEISRLAAPLHKKRNFIAHGNFVHSIAPLSSHAFNFSALRGDAGEKWQFELEDLIELAHDISHLHGDLFMALNTSRPVQGPFVAFLDSELLRVYRETIHPWNPDPQKRPPAPDIPLE